MVSRGRRGDHSSPTEYKGGTIEKSFSLTPYVKDYKNIAKPKGGGGRNLVKFYRDTTKVL